MHVKKQNISGQMRIRQEIYKDAIAYYRLRPDEFCEDIISIKINVYQKIMLRCIFKYDYVMFIMCRGLGKTFLAMLALVIYALLYPNQKIGIICPSFRQGKILIQEKYKDEFCQWSAFLRGEEESFVCNNARARIDFYNGSFIEAFPVGVGSGTNAASKIRGARLTAALCDEAVYIPEEIIENVLIPMLIVQSGYKVGDKEGHGTNNKLIMTSSASYRFNHLYKRYVKWTEEMLKENNTKYFTMTLPWQVGVAVGLFKEDFIMQQKKNMSKERFEQEYEGIFSKLIDGSWINYQDLITCSDLQHIETKGVKGFEYIMSLDVARVNGGDNSIVNIFKLHWFKDHVECDLVYTVSMNGKTFAEQSKVIRKLLKRFPQIIRIFMDCNGLTFGLAPLCGNTY